MHLSASRLFLAVVLLGLWASAALAGGQGCDDKPSACGGQCPSGHCSPCDQPRPGCGHDCASGCPAYGCPGHSGCGDKNRCDKECCDKQCCDKECCEENCCQENCCQENCCEEGCSCPDACRAWANKRCGNARCKDGDDEDEEEEGEEGDGGDCGDEEGDLVNNSGCCDGWFFGNWFKGWGASSNKFHCASKNGAGNGKCEKFHDAAKYPARTGAGCGTKGRTGGNAVGRDSWGGACGVVQAAANACGCKCGCSKCQCGKDKQNTCQAACTCPAECGAACRPNCPPCGVGTAHACPLGFCAPQHTAAAAAFTAAVPPPPAPPGCPVMGPHREMFQRFTSVMAENAALHARLQAKADWADEQQCLRAALTEAREEVARLTAAHQNSGNKDQVIVEWIKAQSEASARKDEIFTEVLGAVIEMQAAKSEASAAENLAAKVEKLEASLQQMKEENAKLKTRVSHLKRETKRVSTGQGASCSGQSSCPSQYKVQVEPVDCPAECPR